MRWLGYCIPSDFLSLAGCVLHSSSFAEMARHVRDLATGAGVPLGLVLEGGYAPQALAESVRAALTALPGDEPPRPVAEEPPLTRQAIAQFERYWPL